MPLFTDLNFNPLSGHSYLLIGGVILVGTGLLIISLIVNAWVAQNVRNDLRHREKLLEYYRNTVSQLGVILVGIGVSLFMFFFQQNYQDHRRREAELQQVLSRMAVRIARGAAAAELLGEFDALLDVGGPYIRPEDGGANGAVIADGPALTDQVRQVLLVERDVDPSAFGVLNGSPDLESALVSSELDPVLWFNLVRDESDLNYAAAQLAHDYRDLHDLLGSDPVAVALADPERKAGIKQEVLDVMWDADLLRQRSRRLLARACWLYSKGTAFVTQKPAAAIEANPVSHQEWLDTAQPFLAGLKSGTGNCNDLLGRGTAP